jgi:hypothetical protein
MPTLRRLLTATLLVVTVVGCGANSPPSPATTTTAAAAAPTTTAVAPPTTVSAKAELLAAYNRSWQVYADALRRLDPSRLGSAFAGSALRAAQQEVATQKANNQPVRIEVEHHPRVLLVTATDGVVADEGVNHSVVLDPATGKPTEPDPNERFRERRSFKFLDDSWKVVEIIEEHRS